MLVVVGVCVPARVCVRLCLLSLGGSLKSARGPKKAVCTTQSINAHISVALNSSSILSLTDGEVVRAVMNLLSFIFFLFHLRKKST